MRSDEGGATMDKSSIVRLVMLGYMATIQRQVVRDGNRLLGRAFRYRKLPVSALIGMLFEDADVLRRNLWWAALRPFEHYRATFHEGRPHDVVDVERCVGRRVSTRYQHKVRNTPARCARDILLSKYKGQVAVVPKGERAATIDAIARRAARLGQDGRKVEVQEGLVSRAELAKLVQNPSQYVKSSTYRSLATMVALFTAADMLARAIPLARTSIRRHQSDANEEHPSTRELVSRVAQDIGREVLIGTLYSLVDAALALSGRERTRLALQVLPIFQNELNEQPSAAEDVSQRGSHGAPEVA